MLLAIPFLLFCLYLVVASVHSYWRLRHFKGPKLAAWTDLWYVKLSQSGKAHLLLGELVDKYGEVSRLSAAAIADVTGNMCRIGTNTLLTDDEDFIRKMNAVRSEYSKSEWYNALKMDGNHHNILSETDHAGHIDLRNKLVNGYAGTNNPNFESDVDVVLWDVINLINDKYISQGPDLKPLDFSAVMQYFTLDVVTSLSLGKAFGYVRQDKDIYNYIQTMWENFPVMNFMLAYPPVVRFLNLPAIQKNLVPSVKDRTGLGKIKGVAFDTVKQRFAEKQSGKEGKIDMMDSFIKNGLSESQIADNTLAQLLAGSDTTVAVLRATFVHIVSNPHVYHHLQAECDEVARTIPMDEIIPYQRATSMPYLDACVKESLRYHPAATGLLPRVVPKGGDYYNGKYLPPGTVIGLAQWNMTRKNKVYGEDCEVFRPERWLEASPEKLARMEKSHELLFMTGRHRCLGERIARTELYKMTFEVLRRFELASMNPLRPIDQSVNYGIWMQRGMWMRVERRDGGGK